MKILERVKAMLPEQESKLDKELKALAEDAWIQGKEMPTIGMYVTDFGELHLIQLDKKDLKAVTKNRLKRLRKRYGTVCK